MKVSEFKLRHRFIKSFDVYPSRDIMKRQTHELEYTKLCFVLHLYWIGPLVQHAPGLLKYYETIWPLISSHVTTFRDNKKRRVPAKFKKDTGEVLRSWLQDPVNAPKMMALMDIYNKTWDPEAADVRLNFRGLDFRGGGGFELYLPAEWAESRPKEMRDLCANLAGSFEFCSGLAGYGLCHGEDVGATAALRNKYAIGRHHPGVDVETTISNNAGQGIKGVNWLTFLHPNFINQFGGMDALKTALNLPGVEVQDLAAGGVMIQAGPTPEIGDTNAQETCPYYHQVGRALHPIRDKKFPGMINSESGNQCDAERTEEWLSRFDE